MLKVLELNQKFAVFISPKVVNYIVRLSKILTRTLDVFKHNILSPKGDNIISILLFLAHSAV